jgi:hypothetical protein
VSKTHSNSKSSKAGTNYQHPERRSRAGHASYDVISQYSTVKFGVAVFAIDVYMPT